MQKLMKALAAIMLTVATLVVAGCTKDPNNSGNNDNGGGVATSIPVVETSPVREITETKAIGSGVVTSDGGGSIIERGVCWSTRQTPIVSGDHSMAGTGAGTFSCEIFDLEPNTTYYVRAYAINSMGVGYGNQVSFTTLSGNGGGVDTQTYTITTSANPADGGTVTGGGTYNEGVSVTLRADANTNYTFDHWQDGSTSNPRTITVTSSATYTAYFTYGGGGSGNGNANGHAYVDLGLPSGKLWATCNVGATTPEGYGNYYAWGETTTKSTYNWSTYRYCNGSSTTLTKYCRSSTYGNNGFTDNLTTLQLSDDAARANWGGDWRVPTRAEWEELKYYTTMTMTTQNGVYGRKFTASNGNSLFLPAAGRREAGSLGLAGSYGCYWSSALDWDNPGYAWNLYFKSGGCGTVLNYRYFGYSVRAVLSASKN